MAAGIVLHAIQPGSLEACIAGTVGVVLLEAIQVLDPAMAGRVVFLATRRRI